MTQGNTQTLRTTNTYAMAVTALMTAVTCILAPLSIPIGPVPISLTNFAIYLALYLLDWKKGTVSYIIYLLLGLVGHELVGHDGVVVHAALGHAADAGVDVGQGASDASEVGRRAAFRERRVVVVLRHHIAAAGPFHAVHVRGPASS